MLCVVLLVCFFFCKQKTAYEMRISDWSSDVCSSDLGHQREGGHVMGHHGAGADHRPGADLIAADDRGVGADRGAAANRRRAELVLALDPGARGIGRASCRERVCPYV